MPSVLLGDRVLITFNGLLCGQRILNTFLYRVSAITAGNDMSAAFTSLHAETGKQGGIRPTFIACCPTNYVLTEVWYQIVAPARFRKMVFGTGTSGLFAPPASVCNLQATVTRVGEQAKRSHVGGIRVPIGGGDTNASDGSTHPVMKTKLDGLATAMKLILITAGTVGTYIPQAGMPKDATKSVDLWDAFPQATVRTMHRRTVGLGI